MFRSLLFSTVLFLTACTDSVSKSDLKNLNGYWEIMEVEFLNGEKKTYKVNPTVDYIEISNMKGFKKKLQPKFNGTYTTSDDMEPFTVIENNGALFLQFGNNFNQWQEELTKLNDGFFTLVDEDGIQYTYKRYHAINITE